MKKVNLISSLSPEKQYEIRRWFWCTVILWVISLAIGGYFITPQLLSYHALKKEVDALRNVTKDYAECLKKRDVLQNENTLLSTRLSKVDRYKNTAKNPYQYIIAIRQAAGDGVTLELLKFNKKDIDCTITCSTSEHATLFVKRLLLSDLFAKAQLVSLHRDTRTQRLKAVIKGVTAV